MVNNAPSEGPNSNPEVMNVNAAVMAALKDFVPSLKEKAGGMYLAAAKALSLGEDTPENHKMYDEAKAQLQNEAASEILKAEKAGNKDLAATWSIRKNFLDQATV